MKQGNKRSSTFDISFILRYSKPIIFGILAIVAIIFTVSNLDVFWSGFPVWRIILPAMLLLLGENAAKMWLAKKYAWKIVCYVFDILLLLTVTVFTGGGLISTFYIVILSEFYLSQETLTGSVIMCASSIGLFLLTFGLSNAFNGDGVNIVAIVTSAFNDIIIIVFHFLIVNFAVLIYRKNTEITKVMDELSESNAKLKKLNEELKDIAVLEERQRIAKDIHDTAGHSITTVIMQTEAAKLIALEEPEEARRRIAAANLQAKHALEELRESVHLLSGASELRSLKDMLLSIVHETMDGTDIVVRTDVDDISLCDAKRRFVCNTLKEGISNGLRHGGATAFWFEFKREGDNAVFLLSDNGRGMQISALKEGFGLSGMHRRAESLGGNLWFESEPDEGFEIHITLPLDGEKGDCL